MTGQSRRRLFNSTLGAAVLIGLYLARLYNYLLFHTLVEIFSVVVASGIFIIAWNARSFMANNYFLFTGIAFLFVGATDLLHALAYKGMGIFPGHDANLPTQLWVIARYLQGSALLVAPLSLGRKLRPHLAVTVYLAATVLLLAAVFGDYFPDCFVEGEGLTPFKKGSEYLVAFMLVGALVFMRHKAEAFDRGVSRLLSVAIGVLITSELAFTLYVDVYGFSNMVGHFLKFAGFWLVYKAIIETGLKRPYDLLFRELKLNQVKIEVLNTSLATRAHDLEEANCELEAANQELEAFNYTVSHDLRSPLTCVKGYSQLLLKGNGAGIGDEESVFVHAIHDAAERMEQLIATLLDFSRVSRTTIDRQEVDLCDLARGVFTELRMGEPERKVTFRAEERGPVNGDVKLLRVVLQNLIGNAWKYSAPREEALIEFGVEQRDGRTVHFVRDNGVGFDMACADRLFDVFQRLHSAEEFKGTGIGLATVKRIVQRHGGEVWAEAEEGKGATFSFTLG